MCESENSLKEDIKKTDKKLHQAKWWLYYEEKILEKAFKTWIDSSLDSNQWTWLLCCWTKALNKLNEPISTCSPIRFDFILLNEFHSFNIATNCIRFVEI